MKRILFLFLIVASFHTSVAQHILIENFDYEPGRLTGNEGWTAFQSTDAHPIQVVTGGLEFDGYTFSDSDGKAIRLNPAVQAAEALYHNFSSPIDAGAFYLSFLVKVERATSVNNDNPTDFLSLSSSTRYTTRARLSAMENSPSTYTFRLTWGADKREYRETDPLKYGVTYLVVLKYNRKDGRDNDKISLYTFDAVAPKKEPASAAIAPFGYDGDIDPGSVNLCQFGADEASNHTQDITIDGMMAGNSWSAIVGSGVDVITFHTGKTADKKRGNIGFLHSINMTAPVDSFVTLIKPKLWRVGRYNDAFRLYHRLKGLGVERQLLVLSDLRTEKPYRDIYRQHGYGAMTDSIIRHTQAVGLEYEFDIFNEPNRQKDFELSKFMAEIWNPAYRAIRKAFPDAKIHGPATSINSFGQPEADSLLMFQFIDEAITHNTLPDYINWHIQIGYNIGDWHMEYTRNIENYIKSKGHSILGTVVGETVRPGSERNTSPGKLADVFAAAEVGDIPQIHAAWSSSKVYGVSTSIPPVLCGILTDSTGTGRRGAWWTYRFFAETEGSRIECENSPTGSEALVGVAFRDDDKEVVRAIVGLRDTKKKQHSEIVFNHLDKTPYIASQGKVHVKMWYNHQTEYAVEAFGSKSLPLIVDQEIDMIDQAIKIPVTIDEWDAVLIELSKPSSI